MNFVQPNKNGVRSPYLGTDSTPKQDRDKNLKKWVIFPDQLPNQRFTGYQTRDNPSQNRGAFVIGQNVKMTLAQTPTVRDGYETIGTDLGDSTPVTRAWTYETRDGVQFEIKAFDENLYYIIYGVTTDYQLLKDGFTPNLEFGYGNISRSVDIAGATIFCNGTDNWFKFTGAYASFASKTDTTLTVQGSTTLINRLFRPEGTIILNGEEVTYTNLNGNVFEGCSTIPVAAVGDVFVQSPTPIDGSYLWQVYSGTYATYASDNSSDEITVEGSVSLENLGFPSSGTIRMYGEDITYASLDNLTFKGCDDVPMAPVIGDVIALKPTLAIGNLSKFKSSVVMAHDGRLHARQETKKSVWNYSVLDNPYDMTTVGSSDTNAGAKEVEFGGPIVGFGKLNKTAIALKPRMVKLLEFNQVGDRVDSPVYKTLVSVDDKGTSLGATNQKSTFSTPLGLVFITPDKRMVLLTGVTANSEPQYLFLSDPIQQVFQLGVHDTATGICQDNEIWYAFKQDNNSTFNDVVIHGNMLRQTFDNYGRALPIQWDTPYIGWNVADFTIVFNPDLGKNELHWHSSITSSSYRVITDKTDDTQAFTSIIRTWEENFGAPEKQKKFDYCFVEIQMLENTVVQANLLYDENGVTGQPTYLLKGSMLQDAFGSTPFNPMGSSPYGWQQIGSNLGESGLTLYRFWLEVDPNIPFFNISLQLSGDTQNNDFNLVRVGWRLVEVIEDIALQYKVNIDS